MATSTRGVREPGLVRLDALCLLLQLSAATSHLEQVPCAGEHPYPWEGIDLFPADGRMRIRVYVPDPECETLVVIVRDAGDFEVGRATFTGLHLSTVIETIALASR